MVFHGFVQALLLIAVAVFWIFVLWMFWMIVKTLRSIDEGIKDVARALREEP